MKAEKARTLKCPIKTNVDAKSLMYCVSKNIVNIFTSDPFKENVLSF